MHRLVSPVKIALAGCIAAAFAATPATGAIIRDFESGTPWPSAYLSVPTDTSIEVVEHSFTQGPTSNVLRLRDTSESDRIRLGYQSVDDDGVNTGLTQGTLSLTFEVTDGTDLRITLGNRFTSQGGSNGVVGATPRAFQLSFSPGDPITNSGHATNAPAPVLDQLVTAADTMYQLEIRFDVEAWTWSGTLNGVAITSNGSASIPFNGDPRFEDIHIIEFANGGSASATGDIYIDNIALVVPEPASLALFGLGALAMMGRRRRHA